jgi:hypothetical protein
MATTSPPRPSLDGHPATAKSVFHSGFQKQFSFPLSFAQIFNNRKWSKKYNTQSCISFEFIQDIQTNDYYGLVSIKENGNDDDEKREILSNHLIHPLTVFQNEENKTRVFWVQDWSKHDNNAAQISTCQELCIRIGFQNYNLAREFSQFYKELQRKMAMKYADQKSLWNRTLSVGGFEAEPMSAAVLAYADPITYSNKSKSPVELLKADKEASGTSSMEATVTTAVVTYSKADSPENGKHDNILLIDWQNRIEKVNNPRQLLSEDKATIPCSMTRAETMAASISQQHNLDSPSAATVTTNESKSPILSQRLAFKEPEGKLEKLFVPTSLSATISVTDVTDENNGTEKVNTAEQLIPNQSFHTSEYHSALNSPKKASSLNNTTVLENMIENDSSFFSSVTQIHATFASEPPEKVTSLPSLAPRSMSFRKLSFDGDETMLEEPCHTLRSLKDKNLIDRISPSSIATSTSASPSPDMVRHAQEPYGRSEFDVDHYNHETDLDDEMLSASPIIRRSAPSPSSSSPAMNKKTAPVGANEAVLSNTSCSESPVNAVREGGSASWIPSFMKSSSTSDNSFGSMVLMAAATRIQPGYSLKDSNPTAVAESRNQIDIEND